MQSVGDGQDKEQLARRKKTKQEGQGAAVQAEGAFLGKGRWRVVGPRNGMEDSVAGVQRVVKWPRGSWKEGGHHSGSRHQRRAGGTSEAPVGRCRAAWQSDGRATPVEGSGVAEEQFLSDWHLCLSLNGKIFKKLLWKQKMSNKWRH
jgi:hypothetical protein